MVSSSLAAFAYIRGGWPRGAGSWASAGGRADGRADGRPSLAEGGHHADLPAFAGRDLVPLSRPWGGWGQSRPGGGQPGSHAPGEGVVQASRLWDVGAQECASRSDGRGKRISAFRRPAKATGRPAGQACPAQTEP